ncbi:MAG: hypothetical protein ACI4UN_08010 [Muribaculaceae bacterium]
MIIRKSMLFIMVSFFLLTIATTVSCSDDLYMTNEAGSELTEDSQYRISRFNVEEHLWDIPADHEEIALILTSKSDGLERTFRARVEHKSGGYVIGMLIPKKESLPDSDYSMRATLADGTSLGSIIHVIIRNEMVHRLLGSEVEYKLEGSGTEKDPYRVKNAKDFNTLLLSLSRDTIAHASGLHFRQTADFTAPATSNVVDGRLYSSYDFAGHYDGGGNSISLLYQGSGNSEKDSNVGLFTTLRDNAHIENLTIKALMSGMVNCCGALAAESRGTVNISNVSIAGSIEGKENIGAFVGKASGALVSSNCSVSGKVSGEKYVGGIVGSVDNGSLSATNFYSLVDDAAYFSVEATRSHAGGLAGLVNSGAINLGKISVRHTVSEEDIDLKVISAPEYCGGLFGEAKIDSTSTIKSCEVVAPISSSGDYVGGLIGKAALNAELQLNFTAVGAYLQGSSYVGGLFGHITTNGNLHFLGSDSSLSNCVCVIDNSYCEIRGSKYVGGLFGFIHGDIKAESAFVISTNVIGSSNFVGGVAGGTEWSTIDCTKFLCAPNMIVQGPDAVGGIVGYASSSTVKGKAVDKFDPTTYPASGTFKSSCSCIVRCEAKGSSYIGGTSIGGIVGYAHDTYLENLCFTGTVTGTDRVGGIVGHFNNESRGHLKCCVGNANEVNNTVGTSTGGVAGLVQYANCSISNLINYSEVTGCDYTGGVIGRIKMQGDSDNYYVEMLLNQGIVDGTVNVGGCLGYVSPYAYNEFTIKNSCNNESVTSTAEGNVGGIIGYGNLSRLHVLHCANHGSVVGKGESKVGGIAGRLGMNGSGLIGIVDNMEMAYCCNRGEISSDNKYSNVGGLLGYQEDGHFADDVTYMTHDCYNAGTVTSDQEDDNGGIVGNVDNFAEVVRCINFGKVSNGNAVVGTHKAGTDWYHHNLYYEDGTGKGWCAESFKKENRGKKEIYENFDFSSVWDIDTNKNDGYPHLRNCPFQFKP